MHLHTPGLNLDGLHDFGEGVGVDMRDFGHGRDDLGMSFVSSYISLTRLV